MGNVFLVVKIVSSVMELTVYIVKMGSKNKICNLKEMAVLLNVYQDLLILINNAKCVKEKLRTLL